MATAPEAARPGRTFFVPGVRIVPLPPIERGTVAGGNAICDAPASDPPRTPSEDDFATIAQDIIDVTVNLVASGSGEYTIILNNAYTELPADRREAGARLTEAWPDGRPRTPRFKYNDFALLQFGMRLRIDMRYWPDRPGTLEEQHATGSRWVPMISGPISDMKFSFSKGEGARLTITGEDDLAPLKDQNSTRTNYGNRSEQEIVHDVLRRARIEAIPLAPTKTWPEFARDRARALAETHQEGQTHLNYLQKLAERLDFEVFAEFDELSFPDSPEEGEPAKPPPKVELHFERSRSRVSPKETLRDIYILEHGKNLLDFTPTFKVRDQYTRVRIRGRHRVPGTAKAVDGIVDFGILADELHRDPARKDPPLVPGPGVRKRLYGGNCYVERNVTNVDDERAEVMAGALLRKKAREFLKIKATVIGLPRLRPGYHVEIRGMRPPFDGFYYVEKSTHRYNNQGYTTEIDARRPGMPVPPYGEQ